MDSLSAFEIIFLFCITPMLAVLIGFTLLAWAIVKDEKPTIFKIKEKTAVFYF